MDPKVFAYVVLYAQRVRDTSWDEETKSHTISQSVAAAQACDFFLVDKAWAGPVELLNITCWNDIQLWCKNQGNGHV
jgi:hypothetical protein